MLAFYDVYFRSHYYVPSPRFVKRKRQIRAIGPALRLRRLERSLSYYDLNQARERLSFIFDRSPFRIS